MSWEELELDKANATQYYSQQAIGAMRAESCMWWQGEGKGAGKNIHNSYSSGCGCELGSTVDRMGVWLNRR